MKKIIYTIIMCANLAGVGAYGQDPSFSQFFSSPLNINPALTANINADWRMVMNLRDQWLGPASPYMTGTISYDSKILQKKIPNVAEENIMGVGGMIMYDYAMNGIAKSTYASLNLSYSIKLSEAPTTQRLGLGFGAIYGRKFVDFSRLNFQEQFTGFGFNTNLPTGEAALANMKPYFSASAGILYSVSTENSNFDMGVAAFHVNKPKQTFLKDTYQFLPIRKVAHANYERFINERVVFNSNAVYQIQAQTSYFSVGGALGYYLGDEDASMITGGLWYWSKNAVIPYVGLSFKSLQFGFSYDITTSKLNQAQRKPNTWELSVVLKGKKDPTGVIPCPWK
jgi:type IX secretion system PorP/SprF family membrane protein